MLTIKRPGLQGAVDISTVVVPIAGSALSDFVAVGAVSAQFPLGTMSAGHLFVFSSSTDCWIAQGANPTAAKAAGSMFVQKGALVYIDGAQGARLAVLQDAAGGNASLVEITG
jgi:hypothetical protein